MSSRTRLGWDPFFENQIEPETTVARVVQVERDAWRLDGDVEGWFNVAGRLRQGRAGHLPAVGDWVVIQRGVIARRLERRSVISRAAAGRPVAEQVIAANVDTVFVVTSANEDLSERRLERYMTMIWDSGAVPVVVVNKSDLVDAPETIAAVLQARVPFVDVLMVSAHSAGLKPGGGICALLKYLGPGRTVALVGSSGVGKSTIINRLIGNELQRVAAIRGDGRGRHTTTARQLIVLDGGALLIDTPGMRELTPWSGDDAVQHAFQDIASLAERCRFGDCAHDTEPGCAVQAAIAAGMLDPDRLENYQRLLREAAFERRKRDKTAAAEHRKRWKQVAQAQKALYKDRER